MTSVGQRLLRPEDPRLLVGKGCYTDDFTPAGALYAAILRSPYAHAHLHGIRVAKALKCHGVVDILTGADLPADLKPIPLRLTGADSIERCLQYPLARDRIRYVGEPLAVVIARSRYEAEDALDRIELDCEPLPAVTTVEDGLRADAPVLHPSLGHNLGSKLIQERGDVEAAFREADVIVEATLRIQRHGAVPLEPRALVAEWDPVRKHLTVYGAAKTVHFNRTVLASLLDLSESQIRMVELDVGGGFGGRGEFYPEDFLIPYVAIQIGRPIKWTEDRRENLLALNHSREQTHHAALALTRDGMLLGLRDRILVDHGAYMRTHGITVSQSTTARLPGPYRLPNFRLEAWDVMTNKTPTGTYRGPGTFESAFVRERLLDMAAKKIGLDPAELRARNLIRLEDTPYPIMTQMFGRAAVIERDDPAELLEEVVKAVERKRWRNLQKHARDQGRRLGIGFACHFQGSGTPPWEYARVELDRDGKFTLYTGGSELGQGMTTGLAQILADELDTSIDNIRVVRGDTDRVPYGLGSWGSRTIILGGGATVQAGAELKKKMLQRAAEILETAVEDLAWGEHGIQIKGAPSRSLSIEELARQLSPESEDPRPVLSAEATYRIEHHSQSCVAQASLVEVDSETGEVRVLDHIIATDVGKAINPMLVEGQLQGAFAQGLGGALLEEFRYDENGQLLSGSFMDYLLPSACEVPGADCIVLEAHPHPHNIYGVRGAGEEGVGGVGASVANAVVDACSDLGVEVEELPLSPDRVLKWVRNSEASSR